MCANCIRTRVDITEGIPKQCPMQNCRACGRWLNPPKQWVACQPESKELLTICLKRIKGLNKVKLIDASFVWTEAHSKRLKVGLQASHRKFSWALRNQPAWPHISDGPFSSLAASKFRIPTQPACETRAHTRGRRAA